MVHKTVYLAGPISGLTYGEAIDWRDEVRAKLLAADIKALSPLRAKVYLADRGTIEDDYNEVMSTSRGITTRDRFDCCNCDLLFVNLLNTKKVSIGTVMEIAWADGKRKPIVLVMEDEGNLHDHAMIRECVGFRVPTVHEGLDIVKAILGDY